MKGFSAELLIEAFPRLGYRESYSKPHEWLCSKTQQFEL